MIIKSMSRKAPSFAQLIDYIGAEAKTGTQANHRFSIFHNSYSRHAESLKAEFLTNAARLSVRKNGVYLYHEVISITRSAHTPENHQKEALQKIVKAYLRMRASKQLAYAVLHEDKKDNLHFHLVISANEVGDSQRKRISKSDFLSIQTQIEKWTLEAFPELEQQAVFVPNQTQEQKQARAKKAHISNQGAEMQRRGGKATERDRMKATLEAVFSTATNGQHFAELLQKAGLKFYTRGKNHGVSTEDGTKYRFSTLGLAEAWEALDQRMTQFLHRTTKNEQNTTNTPPQQTPQNQPFHNTQKQEKRTVQDTSQDMFQDRVKAQQEATYNQNSEHHSTVQDTSQDTKRTAREPPPTPDFIEQEIERRQKEMKAIREKKANKQTQHHTNTHQKPQP